MKGRINLYIFGQFVRVLGFSLLALVGMFWLGQAVPLIEQIILRGETVGTFFRLAVLLIPKIVHLMMPVAALIAVVFTLNKFAVEGELLSIHNSGRHPMKLLLPVSALGFILVIVHLFLTLWLAPAATNAMRTNLYEIRNNFSNNVIVAQNFVSPDANLYIYADQSVLSGEMKGVFIDDRRDKKIARNYFSDKAIIVRDDTSSKLALIEGEFHERDIETGQVSIGRFDRLEIEIESENSELVRENFLLEEKSTAQVMTMLDDPEQGSAYFGELMDRISFPFLSIALPIIGVLGFVNAPFSRKGYGRIVAKAVGFGLAVEAAIFSVKSIVTSNTSLAFVAIIPFLWVIGALYFTYQNTKVRRA